MKQIIVFSMVLGPTLVPMFSTQGFSQCASVFSGAYVQGPPIPSVAKWRAKITHVNSEQTVAPTDAAREQEMSFSIKRMQDAVLVDESTPLMEFFTAKGVTGEYLVETPGYHSGVIDRLEVGSLGPSGVLRGTFLLPTSGHVSEYQRDAQGNLVEIPGSGAANARKFVANGTYQLSVQAGPSGTEKSTELIKVLDVVTVQEFSITLKKGEMTTIYYSPTGSAGPGGFSEGRTLEIIWDGT